MAKGQSIGSQNVALKEQLDKALGANKELNHQLDAETARADHHEKMAKRELPIPEAAPVAVPDLVGEMQAVPAVEEPKILFDPYDSQNPHKFIAHPSGFKLGWKNPKYRDGGRGWRGWIHVEYSSDIGRNLTKYLLDPPRRMDHAVDNIVRRGDAVLCYLPLEMWLARQKKRTDKANRLAADTTVDQSVGGKFAAIDVASDGKRLGGSTLLS